VALLRHPGPLHLGPRLDQNPGPDHRGHQPGPPRPICRSGPVRRLLCAGHRVQGGHLQRLPRRGGRAESGDRRSQEGFGREGNEIRMKFF